MTMHHIAMFAMTLISAFMDFFKLAIYLGLRLATPLDSDPILPMANAGFEGPENTC